jgi:serine-type D-Ala-D-Ala carboxypeptidase/endopeptidase
VASARDRAERRARRHVGAVVGVASDGTTQIAGFGVTGPNGGTPDEATSFQIGSVTKVVTALLLAEAVTRGEVALDQPLTAAFPSAAPHPSGRPIRLVDLATHSSGLPRLPPGFVPQARRQRHDPYANFTIEQLEQALTQPPKRPPGGRPRYSNYGAGVLGEALARLTGDPYAQLVHDRIVVPLGLRDTSIEVPGSGRHIAVGHTRRGQVTPDWHLPALAGAGALRSSVRDLLVLLRAHLDPDSTSLEPAVRLVLEPRARISRPLAVGLGWHILDRKDGARWWWHNGGTGGFRSYVGFDPTARRAVAVLANDPRSVDRIGQLLLERPRRDHHGNHVSSS